MSPKKELKTETEKERADQRVPDQLEKKRQKERRRSAEKRNASVADSKPGIHFKEMCQAGEGVGEGIEVAVGWCNNKASNL